MAISLRLFSGIMTVGPYSLISLFSTFDLGRCIFQSFLQIDFVCRLKEKTVDITHFSSLLFCEGIHQLVHPMLHWNLGVKQKLFDVVHCSTDVEIVWHQRVPMVQVVEFHWDSVWILEWFSEHQLWFEEQFEIVIAQMLNVILNNNLDCFTCKKTMRREWTLCNK